MSWSLLFFVGINVLAAMSGRIFSPGEWFDRLEKPNWHPPDWVFPVTWTVLYVLNAIAGWIIWDSIGFTGTGILAMAIYVISLMLNAFWSAIFFGMRKMRLALFEAMLLWVSVLLQMIVFFQVQTSAGLLLLPYIVWVSIAVKLNSTMLKLNPTYA